MSLQVALRNPNTVSTYVAPTSAQFVRSEYLRYKSEQNDIVLKIKFYLKQIELLDIVSMLREQSRISDPTKLKDKSFKKSITRIFCIINSVTLITCLSLIKEENSRKKTVSLSELNENSNSNIRRFFRYLDKSSESIQKFGVTGRSLMYDFKASKYGLILLSYKEGHVTDLPPESKKYLRQVFKFAHNGCLYKLHNKLFTEKCG